ncbi:MAG: hypothetical protein AMXMBFR34_09560 [Myxococcaceae bacterium]
MKKTALIAIALLAVLMVTCCLAPSALGLLRGGGGGSSDYWTNGCVTGDERLLLAGGSESVAIDLETGKQVARHEQFGESTGCGKSDGVVYGVSDTMVRFPTNEQVGTDDPAAEDRVEGTPVHYSRSRSQNTWRGFANVREGARALELKPALFGLPGPERSVNALITWPGNVLPGGRLVVLAGWRPNRLDAVEPAPWGVFAVDVSAGTVQQIGATHHASEGLNPTAAPQFAASSDGRMHVAAMGAEPVVRVALYEADEQPRAVVELDRAREATAIRYSEDGALIAVGTLSPQGMDSTVAIIDTARMRVVWRSEPAKGTVYVVRFLADGSLVFMRSSRTVTRVTREGRLLWSTPGS